MRRELQVAFEAWRRSAVMPRIEIWRLLPSAGGGLLSSSAAINVVLGLLPVAFVVATSVLIGELPAALAGGERSTSFRRVIEHFALAALCFVLQQVLTPLRNAIGERIKRRVDGLVRDETLRVVLASTGIAAMEDEETANALSEVTRQFDTGWYTPGMSCAGMLALVARYVRLLALLAIIGAVASAPVALATGAATVAFRVGNRGGLRRFSAVWREVAGKLRRARYLAELGISSPAAKELRIFGLVGFLSRRYAEAFFEVYRRVSARRRQIYFWPYLAYTALGLGAGAWAILTIGQSAALGITSLGDLALGVQAVSMALLLGEFYAECDVPTQFGMTAVMALDEVRRRVTALDRAAPRGQASVDRRLPSHALRIDNVSFSYPGSTRCVLAGLDLELPAGKSTAIVGVNGAGKTTLVKLLTRLHEPTAGVVRADGLDIALFDPGAWRRQVSVIFQDFVRYELSAADNVALGAVHVPRDQAAIERAAERAGILAHLSSLPQGLDTPLGSGFAGSVELSGGQWQRIAIARALYALEAGARVLILDEPTAALDVRAEAAFFERFVELTRGVTSVLISHRFSSVRRADRIVVIDGGRVVEQGSHSELMAHDGHYARLFRLQAARFAAKSDVVTGPAGSAVADGPSVALEAS